MVAAPFFCVVSENLPGKLTQSGFPGSAIASVIAHHKIWHFSSSRSRIDISYTVNSSHNGFAILRTAQRQQPGCQLLEEALLLCAWSYNALLLAALQVQVEEIETGGIRARVFPVNILQHLTLRKIEQRHVT